VAAANIIERVTRIMDEFDKVNFVCTDNDHNIKEGIIEVRTTGIEPAVGEEAENTLAHTLELRFLKMFEFKDEEGVFYDVLNVEGLQES